MVELASMPATILYLNTADGDRIQAMTLAGIRRYAGVRGWKAMAVPWQESRPPARNRGTSPTLAR